MRDARDESQTAKRYARVGEWLAAILKGHGTTPIDGLELTEIRIRLPREGDPMVLLIVKGTSPAGKHIAFVGAGTPNQALLAWRKKDAGAGLKWKEDMPWQSRS